MRLYNPRNVMQKAFVDLPKMCKNMANKQEVVKSLEAIATRAGMIAAYIEEREGYGCGDQGHDKAIKEMNKTGRIIHMKAFGYNAFHDLTFSEKGG